jgi:heme/copper-type cytochrome/quinol oxidase subunit 2
MRHGLSGFFGAVTAWLCLAPVAFTRESMSIPNTLVPRSIPVHFIANQSAFVIWIAGGTLLAVGGLLTFGPFRSRAHKSDPLGQAEVCRSTEIDLVWTVIPVLVLVLFLA